MDKCKNERTNINIIGSDTFLYSLYATLYVISMMSACDVDLLFKIPSTSFFYFGCIKRNLNVTQIVLLIEVVCHF